ncbi:MAG: SpoIIE family protein phosphatase [Bacteroidales bacterium]|nr:SpoIIE family protein phosphatase [Bacteroidales bacterium]
MTNPISYSIRGVVRSIILMTFFLGALPVALVSQTYYFERYGAEQGLNTSKVYVSLQDSKDYIWLGTDVGLTRFDGSKLQNFGVDNGLAPGGVRSVCEDTTGRLWFGHLNGGISYFDGQKFTRAAFDDGHIVSDITSIRQQGDYLWVTTYLNGAMRLNFPDTGDTILIGEQYHGNEGLSDIVPGSYVDSKGNYYCITDLRGIRIYLPEENRFESFSPPGLTREWQFTAMLEDSKGNFWFGTHLGGLYKMEKGSNEAKVFDKRDGLARNWITCLMEDYKGDIWVGTNGEGITVFNGDRMRNYNLSNGLQAIQVFSLMEDKEKNIIITDYATGFSIYKGDHIYTIEGSDVLAGNYVYAVQELPGGVMWLGTEGGISVYDPAMGRGNKKTVYNMSTNAIGDQMRFLERDNAGTVWIGTHGNGVSFYDIESQKFRWDNFLNVAVWSQARSQRIAKAMTFDNRGNLWIGTDDGLFLWYPDKWEGYQYTRLEFPTLAGNMITALFGDSKGNIWIGSENNIGLTKHTPQTDPEKGEFVPVELGDKYIARVITETPDGRIWVGTEGGLIVLKDNAVELKLTDKEVLLSNNIKQLLADGDFMYVGTNRGLNRIHIADGKIATFTRRNGFTGIEATPNGSFRDSRGRLWFGTSNGVTVIDPSRYPPLNNEPLTHLSAMMINNEPREMTTDLRLSFRENSISFDYYSVCVTNPDAIGFMVMLEGADDTWRPVTNQTTAYYSALNPGQYTFRVKASNSYGYWNEEPVSYSFTIRPPFYKAPWFIVLMVIAVLALTALYIKMREMNLIREKKILEEKVEERTAEVVQKSLIIEEKNRDITASIRYAERIQRAMLPPDDLFPETFVLFRPKDIVSGDFFWMYDNGDYEFIAAVDCTGHGVPGAFMSIIGHNSLNKIVREYGIVKPSAILDQLNNEVVKALLGRHETTVNDGMDLTLLAYDKKNRKLEFAGAYNPLYLVRKGEMIVHKSDRFPIGMSTMEQKKSFTNVVVDIEPGDMIYMSSDGYADQFGGEDGSKYKSANFKKLLTQIYDLPVGEQKNRLDEEIMRWKGDLQQVDDILVIGTRIT